MCVSCTFVTEVVVKGGVVVDYMISRQNIRNTSEYKAAQYNTITNSDLNAKYISIKSYLYDSVKKCITKVDFMAEQLVVLH